MAAKSDKARAPKPKEIRQRYEAADKKYRDWESLYDMCFQYAAPQRNLFGGRIETDSPGGTKMGNVFDSTAIASLDRFANRVQANVFPPQRQWAKLKSGTKVSDDRKFAINGALDTVADTMFAVMRSSNFDIAIGEFLHDIGIGTAHLCIQPGSYADPVTYTAVSPAAVRFEEDENGRPCNHYRKIKMRGELIEKAWRGAKLTEQLTREIADKPQDEVELLESTIRDLETDRYHYQIITFKSDNAEDGAVIFHRSQKYSNWVTSRYSKLSGELMGRGPVMCALPDIRTLNKVKELLLRKAAFNIVGAYTAVDDGVLNPNNIDIAPNSIIAVAANAGARGPSLAPLPQTGDLNLAQFVINDLVASIKKILLDESLPPDNMSARSATEIVERMKELAQNMGSAFGRLIDEVLIPVVEITLHVLNDAGILVFPLKVDGRDVAAVPVAPLAMAQNMDEVQAIVQFGQLAAQLGPEGQAALNKGRTIDYVGDRMGVPAQVRNTPDEREAEVAKLQSQAAAMMAAQGGAGAAPPEAPPEAEDVPLPPGAVSAPPQLQAVA